MHYLILFLICLSLPAFAQEPKAATPLATHHSSLIAHHSTRAVVVGISNYQDPGIPDLKYAHRDAEAFANWLRSPAGGSVPEDNVRLLLNENATKSAIIFALYDLLDSCKSDDTAIFYFSGHGDVENKLRSLQPGFLLAHDSPPKVYATNALDLVTLQQVFNELTINQVRTMLITDACHSGKLSGSDYGGTQATALALQQQFSKATRIMSCQPDEVSLEGEEWGGGRGLFSFHLVEGLIGLADNDANRQVTLFEIKRYLEDRVPAEAAPQRQIPLALGDLQFRIATVDAAALAALRSAKAAQADNLQAATGKGLEDEVLARADSLTRARYRAFQRALYGGGLLAAADSSADALFRHLITEEVLRPLHGIMRRNFAVALLDEVQQAINALLADDPHEVSTWRADPAKYADYPGYLERALELLGERHYIRNTLLAQKQYFEAYLHLRNVAEVAINPEQRETERNRARTLLREAIELEPHAAYLYLALAGSFSNTNPPRIDSVAVYCQKAMEYAPQWLMPYLDLFYEYHIAQNNYLAGEKWLLLAVERNPDSYIVLERLAWLRQWQNRTGEALDICRRMIALKPDLFSGYGTMGTTYWMRGEYAQAVELLEQSAQLATEKWLWPTFTLAYFRKRDFPRGFATAQDVLNNPQNDADAKTGTLSSLLTGLYEHQRYDLALPYFNLADSLRGYAYYHVICNLQEAKILFALGRTSEAVQRLRGVFALDNADNAHFALAEAWLGQIAAEAGKTAEADAYFQKAMTVRGFSALDQAEPMEEACALYGHFLLRQNRLPEAEQRFRQALEWRYQNSAKGWYGMACLYAKKGEKTQALDCLEKALEHWYPAPEPIFAEPLFKKIRKTARFKALMKKHFPNQVND
ncbi:MAG: caspase family protein [Lewinellaceae bacterium]|nr:caspase family protein [Lewinellaceae bacterium]